MRFIKGQVKQDSTTGSLAAVGEKRNFLSRHNSIQALRNRFEIFNNSRSRRGQEFDY